MIRELTSRIRVLRSWRQIHGAGQPCLLDTTKHYDKGAREILRDEIKWLIRMLRVARRIAALLMVIPIWWN